VIPALAVEMSILLGSKAKASTSLPWAGIDKNFRPSTFESKAFNALLYSEKISPHLSSTSEMYLSIEERSRYEGYAPPRC